MSIQFTAKLAHLDALIAKLRNAKRAKAKIAAEWEGIALFILDGSFGRRVSPYGEPWKARTRRYPWPILEKTGRLRAGFRARRRGDGVVVTNRVPYGKFHQKGTRRMVARPILPSRARGLPPQWKRQYTIAAKRVLKDHLSR